MKKKGDPTFSEVLEEVQEASSKPKRTLQEFFDRAAKWVQPTTRIRRGKVVEIPPEWRGKVPHGQTVRKRQSKKGQGKRFKRKAQR